MLLILTDELIPEIDLLLISDGFHLSLWFPPIDLLLVVFRIHSSKDFVLQASKFAEPCMIFRVVWLRPRVWQKYDRKALFGGQLILCESPLAKLIALELEGVEELNHVLFGGLVPVAKRSVL